jgi:tetratricopeptide (TPR) repeat protein
MGDSEGAVALENASLALCGDDPYARYPLTGLGYHAFLKGDFDSAEEMFARALELERAIDDAEGVANSLGLLGLSALNRGDDKEAAHLLRQNAELARELGYAWSFATRSLQGISALLAQRGKPADAVRLLGSADAILTERGQPLGPQAERVQGQTLESVRSQLDEAALMTAWDEGRRLYSERDFDTLVAFALDSLD